MTLASSSKLTADKVTPAKKEETGMARMAKDLKPRIMVGVVGRSSKEGKTECRCDSEETSLLGRAESE
jgi:hypothetical protein